MEFTCSTDPTALAGRLREVIKTRLMTVEVNSLARVIGTSYEGRIEGMKGLTLAWEMTPGSNYGEVTIRLAQ